MGLTGKSTGSGIIGSPDIIPTENVSVIALAGNPNVGKSTIFNALTGLKQHTGNWAGKTVTNAQGKCNYNGRNMIITDLPGCYSLDASSAEEETARDFICFGGTDAVIVVCDATILERNLYLVMQIIEITPNAIVCINLMDEAKRKGISINIDLLSTILGVPAVGVSARNEDGLDKLLDKMTGILDCNINVNINTVYYSEVIENSITGLSSVISDIFEKKINPRPIAVRLLSSDVSFAVSIKEFYKLTDDQMAVLENKINNEKLYLCENGIYEATFKDYITDKIIHTSEDICKRAVSYNYMQNDLRDRRIDRIITGRLTGFPIMLFMLAIIFWLTIYGANYPSQLIVTFLFGIGENLAAFLQQNGINEIIINVVINGVYRVLAWVISVMLPPMAIFFPLFTLLEDLGYLPRVAFNLDRCFKSCSACGKQSLTMCMGFGCNAAGVIGCRIIDSPRERLIAIITNSFVPCNGRFPAIISMITMFLIVGIILPFQSVFAAIILTAFIILSIFITLGVSWLLSVTVLRGVPSSFTLELPPYRCPKIGQVLIHSVIDRTLFVLIRAITVAAPAGLIIWLMANITAGDLTLLKHVSGFLDPFARSIGLDGVILTAFILGFPANEIVIPIIIMAYTAEGNLTDISSLDSLRHLFISNGWTVITALCFIVFLLMHWPCSTTLITIYRETKNIRWTAAAFLIPTVIGIVICFAVSNILHFLI